MKIKTVNVVTAVGLSRTIEDRHSSFEIQEFGIVVRPKGKASFSNRPRFIPWANVASCDILTDEEEAARVAQEEAAKASLMHPAFSEPAQIDTAPEMPNDADTIVFTKEANGTVSEKKKRSAFSEAAKAKAE